MLTAHTALFLPLRHAKTHSVRAIHLHTEVKGQTSHLIPSTQAVRGDKHYSKEGQSLIGRLVGGIRSCTLLLDEMSDDSVISHLDRNGANVQEASACAKVVLVL